MIVRFLWPTAVWSGTVLVLTLLPGEKLPDVGFFQFDKLVHIFIFGMMMILTAYGLTKISLMRGRPRFPVHIAAIYSMVFGILVEIIQQFVPGRTLSLADILANTVGVGVGYLIFNRFAKKRTLDTISRGKNDRAI